MAENFSTIKINLCIENDWHGNKNRALNKSFKQLKGEKKYFYFYQKKMCSVSTSVGNSIKNWHFKRKMSYCVYSIVGIFLYNNFEWIWNKFEVIQEEKCCKLGKEKDESTVCKGCPSFKKEQDLYSYSKHSNDLSSSCNIIKDSKNWSKIYIFNGNLFLRVQVSGNSNWTDTEHNKITTKTKNKLK